MAFPGYDVSHVGCLGFSIGMIFEMMDSGGRRVEDLLSVCKCSDWSEESRFENVEDRFGGIRCWVWGGGGEGSW